MPKTTPKETKPKEWLRGTQAGRLLGICHKAGLVDAAERLGIRVRLVPGVVGLRYHREDVERAVEKLKAEEAGAGATLRQRIGAHSPTVAGKLRSKASVKGEGDGKARVKGEGDGRKGAARRATG